MFPVLRTTPPGWDGEAPVAQLDRASDYESEGWGFEFLRAHQFLPKNYDYANESAAISAGLRRLETGFTGQ